MVALDVRAEQLGRGAGAAEAQAEGVDDRVGQAVALDRLLPRLRLGLGGGPGGQRAGGALATGGGVLALALGLDGVGVGRPGGDERREERPAHLEVDLEAVEHLGAVEEGRAGRPGRRRRW